jgi:hypothetical protein
LKINDFSMHCRYLAGLGSQFPSQPGGARTPPQACHGETQEKCGQGIGRELPKKKFH